MNRTDFRKLSLERIADAKVLLRAKRWSAAFYLAGYSVECALKSCIIRHVMATDQFPDKKFSEQCWTHNLSQLLGVAGLKDAFAVDASTDPVLAANWETVKDWNESSRYSGKPKIKAKELYVAITDKKQGILSWIKAHW